MSLNKVQLSVMWEKIPEVRYLDSGVAVATFPLATTDRAYTLPNGTQVPERTEWHNIVLWRGLAETAEKYVHQKEIKLYIEGKNPFTLLRRPERHEALCGRDFRRQHGNADTSPAAGTACCSRSSDLHYGRRNRMHRTIFLSDTYCPLRTSRYCNRDLTRRTEHSALPYFSRTVRCMAGS